MRSRQLGREDLRNFLSLPADFALLMQPARSLEYRLLGVPPVVGLFLRTSILIVPQISNIRLLNSVLCSLLPRREQVRANRQKYVTVKHGVAFARVSQTSTPSLKNTPASQLHGLPHHEPPHPPGPIISQSPQAPLAPHPVHQLISCYRADVIE